MKYEVNIEGRTVAVELEERDGHFSASIDGRALSTRVVRPEEGVYLIFVGDQVYETRVSGDGRNSLRVGMRGREFSATIVDRKHRKQPVEHHVEGQQQLSSPMPGKVVRVLVSAGDEVAAGQGVVVVEAMKMQNEIKSPRRGRVIEILVGEGHTVNASQVLAVVE
ncbi:MAG TPA: biotin/lipoyl-containing protein [Blastocatellia bacterium]|jgi:biotin carboxyl carrier protein|nr:biotin/lipoyl-containing protein [Blastocatellia bacterium]